MALLKQSQSNHKRFSLKLIELNYALLIFWINIGNALGILFSSQAAKNQLIFNRLLKDIIEIKIITHITIKQKSGDKMRYSTKKENIITEINT